MQHDLPIPNDFNNPSELKTEESLNKLQNVPVVAATVIPEKPNLKDMWTREHDIKINMPIYGNNIFTLTDKDQLQTIIGQAMMEDGNQVIMICPTRVLLNDIIQRKPTV